MPTDLSLPLQNRTSKTQNPMTTFGWAVFLGMSWTWCIGMYLPVLLVRDFGFWGWVVFAVPNVIGAAAMGQVLRDSQASERVTSEHSVACAAFSAITIMFQIMFVGGVVRELMGAAPGSSRQPLSDPAGTLLLASVVGTFVLSLGSKRGGLVAAILVMAVSVAAFVMAAQAANQQHIAGFPSPGARESAERVRGLLMLTPVVVFGFLLCPYLDLTFHRARQSTGQRVGAVAFGVAFFGPFLAMIIFTLWYAPLLESHQRAMTLPRDVRWAIGLHMSLQCAFTVAMHGRELLSVGAGALAGGAGALAGGAGETEGARSRKRPGDSANPVLDYAPVRNSGPMTDKRRLAGMVLGFAASLLPHVAATMADKAGYEEHGHGERVYRLFLAYYGLVFPAYVWLCMVPTRDGNAGPTRKKLRVLAAAVLVAAPMYWKGFIDDQMIWLLPGVGVLLLARLLLWAPRGRGALIPGTKTL